MTITNFKIREQLEKLKRLKQTLHRSALCFFFFFILSLIALNIQSLSKSSINTHMFIGVGTLCLLSLFFVLFVYIKMVNLYTDIKNELYTGVDEYLVETGYEQKDRQYMKDKKIYYMSYDVSIDHAKVDITLSLDTTIREEIVL